MATIRPTPSTTQSVVSGTTTPSSTSGTDSTSSTGLDGSTIAGNFQTFLTLLTTQLKNQDPLSPLDTNQFTSQLVQFAQVEQQLKANTELTTLVSLQQTAQNTAALGFVGQKVDVDGNTSALTNGSATWQMTVPKPGTATITIKSATGQQVFSGNYSLNTGTSAVRLGRQGLERPAMARRQLHDLRHRAGRQWPSDGDPDPD